MSRQEHGGTVTASKAAPYSPSIKKASPAGVYGLLPAAWVPYAELVRLAKPAGWLYLYIPVLATTLFAASLSIRPVSPAELLQTNLKFLLGSMIFRGAACTWNDVLDQDIDRKVTRTRGRPLPRGAVSTTSALLYNAVLAALGAMLLLQLPPACLKYSVFSIVMIAIYPLGKRFTQYPQVILAFTWAYGFVMGFPAVGVDPLESRGMTQIVTCLYGSGAAWTVLYDTVYAHQDIKDDKREGVKSIAIRFEAVSKPFLTVLGVVQVLMFTYAGVLAGAGTMFFVGTGMAALSIVSMIVMVDLEDPASCGWWFFTGSCSLTGGSLVIACLGEYLRVHV